MSEFEDEDGQNEEFEDETRKRAAVARIWELQSKIPSFRKIEGPGILALPEKIDSENDDSPPKAKKPKSKSKPTKT